MRKVLLVTIFSGLVFTTTQSYALNAREDIERATELIAEGEYSLARTYLAPALVSAFISAGERSRAYYFRGFTYAAEKMSVSARKDFNRALEFNPSNPAALVALGRLLAAGSGVEKDAELAFDLFSQAATLQYPPGEFHLGYAYLMAEGVAKNLIKAREILASAAGQGQAFAMISLAASYRREHVATPEPEMARYWYENAFEAGDPKALMALAYMHLNGEFGVADPTKAYALFNQASEQGVRAADAALGYAHLTGQGTKVDYSEAFSAYEKAAHGGLPAGFLGLGHLFEFGLGVEQHQATAFSWYQRGADTGDVAAQLRLANAFFKRNTQSDQKQAVYWSRLAAKRGSAQAQNDYAWILATSKFDEMRNGTLALDQAERAVAVDASASFLDTLAAAYAEIGNFKRAVEIQEQALSSLTAEQSNLRGELEARLQYYQRSEPWRE